jgi:hypothetical protein
MHVSASATMASGFAEPSFMTSSGMPLTGIVT